MGSGHWMPSIASGFSVCCILSRRIISAFCIKGSSVSRCIFVVKYWKWFMTPTLVFISHSQRPWRAWRNFIGIIGPKKSSATAMGLVLVNNRKTLMDRLWLTLLLSRSRRVGRVRLLLTSLSNVRGKTGDLMLPLLGLTVCREEYVLLPVQGD